MRNQSLLASQPRSRNSMSQAGCPAGILIGGQGAGGNGGVLGHVVDMLGIILRFHRNGMGFLVDLVDHGLRCFHALVKTLTDTAVDAMSTAFRQLPW